MQIEWTEGEMPFVAEDQVSISQVMVGGVPFWRAGSRLFPVIAGAEDGDGDEGDKGGDDGKLKDDGAGDDFDKERALRTIRTLRDNEKATREQLKELETLRAKVKEAEDAQLSASERATREATEHKERADKLERDLRTERTRSAVEREAAKANLVDPDAAYRLLDLDAIEYGDDGRPKNVERLVADLAKARPYLVGAANGGANARPGTGTNPRPAGEHGRTDEIKKAQRELAESGRYVL